MPEKFIVWGSSGHAKVLADVIVQRGGTILALFDNDPNATSSLQGVPLYSGEGCFSTWWKKFRKSRELHAAIAIGGGRGKDRQVIGKLLLEAGVSLPILIHRDAMISPSATMGTGTQVLAGSVIAADVRIGPFCIINNSANIDHECILEEGVHIAPGAVLCGCVTVRQNAMIGSGAVILPRLEIGRNVIVGAGAVVTKNMPAGIVVAGNPARILKKNNEC